jgi:hypothetical protein
MKLSGRFVETGDPPVRIISLPDDVAKFVGKVGPKGFIHGWIYVGSATGSPSDDEGTIVHHPKYGDGTLDSVKLNADGSHTASVRFYGGKKDVAYRYPTDEEAFSGQDRKFVKTGVATPLYDESSEDAVDRLNAVIKTLPEPKKPDVTPEPYDIAREEKDPWAALGSHESRLIHDYVNPDSTINTDLRKAPTVYDMPAGEDDEVLDLDGMMAKHVSTSASSLYRGFTASPQTLEQLVPGQVFDDHAFVSTAWDPEWAKNFAILRAFGEVPDTFLPRVTAHGGKPVLMKISAPAGSHMIIGESDIAEYVLPRNSRFQVTDVSPDGSLISVDLMPS